MLERFERSWNLAVACMRILQQDKRLLVFPLMSAISMVLIIGSFAVPVIPTIQTMASRGYPKTLLSLTLVALFLFYLVQFAIVTFFNTALAEVAMLRFDGANATVRDGLRRAWSRLPTILVYSVIAATIGTVLRAIEERVGFISKIVIGLIGFVWTVATALVVPLLAAEDVGPLEAIERSVELIMKSWGEDLIGNATMGLVFGLLEGVAAIVGFALVVPMMFAISMTLGVLTIVGLIVVLCLIMLAHATLNGIYSAALYRYADGSPTGSLDGPLLEGAFRARD